MFSALAERKLRRPVAVTDATYENGRPGEGRPNTVRFT